MSSLLPRHIRRQTLIATAEGRPSEGVLVASGDRTIVEVVGGPPSATLEFFAARRRLGSITLDQLGSGSAAFDRMPGSGCDGHLSVALRHEGCTVLEGYLSVGISTLESEVTRL